MLSKIAAVVLLLLAPMSAEAYCTPQCEVSDTGLKLIKFFEGYRPYAYKDAAGHPTIGYGHLIRPGEEIEEPLLGEAATALLRKDVRVAEHSVRKWVLVSLYQGQHDALTSWTFNLGGKALSESLMLHYINLEVHERVPKQMKRWVYAGGKKLRGLELRRAAEAELYVRDADAGQ